VADSRCGLPKRRLRRISGARRLGSIRRDVGLNRLLWNLAETTPIDRTVTPWALALSRRGSDGNGAPYLRIVPMTMAKDDPRSRFEADLVIDRVLAWCRTNGSYRLLPDGACSWRCGGCASWVSPSRRHFPTRKFGGFGAGQAATTLEWGKTRTEMSAYSSIL